MTIDRLDTTTLPAARTFFASLTSGDLTFVKEEIRDDAVLRRWADDPEQRRWLMREADHAIGFVSVLPLTHWSRHVSEIRLVVHPEHRRRGLGTQLAQHGLREAVRRNAEKVVVDAIATDVSTITMLRGLGFIPEALLTEHIRDRSGHLQDLVVLAHKVADVTSGWNSLGLADGLT